jgi:hypothetical protein
LTQGAADGAGERRSRWRQDRDEDKTEAAEVRAAVKAAAAPRAVVEGPRAAAWAPAGSACAPSAGSAGRTGLACRASKSVARIAASR